jgi:hypothetical protein
VDQDQRSKTKNAKSTGDGGDDSLVHEANPDQPHVGGVSPRLFTGGALIRDELSALSLPDTDPSPDSAFLSVTFKMTTKNNHFSTVFLPVCLLLFKFTFISFFKVIKKSQNQCCFIKQN